MPLPLIGLLAGQGVRLLGTHTLRTIAAKEAFDLGESVLAKKAMPFLGEALSLGAKFVPTRGTLAMTAAAAITPSMLGSLVGKADILTELTDKGMREIAGKAIPGLENVSSTLQFLKAASDNFIKDNNLDKFTIALSNANVSGMLEAGRSLGSDILPSLADLVSDILKTASVGLARLSESLRPPEQAAESDDGPRFR